jgi:hypothetical protein
MFTRFTKTSWITKIVLVLAAVALLVPVFFTNAQGPPDDGNRVSDLEPFGGPGPTIDDDLLTPAELQEAADIAAQARFYGAEVEIEGGAAPGVEARTGGRGERSVDETNQRIAEGAFADSPLKKWLYLFVVNFFGFLVFAGGHILDFAVNNFVINFGLEFNTSGVGVAVNDLWSIVRDFFNILFIFGFIWIGFQMILNSGNSKAKQTLVYLIMAALLINFSLFISKFVVDFSNRLATEVAVAAFPAAGGDSVEIADTFFAHLGISETLQVPDGIANDGAEPWAFIFGSAIFYLIAAFVFAAGGVMLIIRFVALSIFMVLSPFMFLGWVFPGLHGWTSKYWKGFLGRAFYAPVYIVLLFFAGSILQNMFGDGGSSRVEVGKRGLLSAVTNNQSNLIEVLGPFVLSAAFMLAAVIVAGKMSADGAGGVMRVGGGMVRGGQRRIKNGAIGVGRFGVRNTAGYAAQGLNYAAKKDSAALRRRLGTMSQGNAVQRWGARTIDRTYGSALRSAEKATIAGSETLDQKKKRVDEQNATYNTYDTENKRATDLAAARAALAAAATPGDTKDAKNKIKKLTGKMSTEELRKLAPAELKTLMESGLVNRTKMKELAGTGQFSNAQMKEMGSKRDDALFKDIEKTFAKSNASASELKTAIEDLSKEIESMSDEEKSNIDFDRLNSQVIASQLSEKSMDAIKDSGNLTSSEFDELKKTRTAGIQSVLSTGRIDAETRDSKGKVTGATTATVTGPDAADFITKQRDKLVKGNAETVGKLPYEAFFNTSTGTLTDAGKNITVDAMKAIGRVANQGKGAMSADERSDLAKAVRLHSGTSSKMATYLNTTKAKEDFLL